MAKLFGLALPLNKNQYNVAISGADEKPFITGPVYRGIIDTRLSGKHGRGQRGHGHMEV